MGLGYFQASMSPARGDITHPPPCSWMARPSCLLHPRRRQHRDWRSPLPVPSSPPPATHSHLLSLSIFICEVDTLLPPPRQVPGLTSCVQQNTGQCLPSSSLWCSFLPCWKYVVRLFATIMEYSPPGSFVHGTFQARILEWVAMPSSRESFQPRDQTHISCLLH